MAATDDGFRLFIGGLAWSSDDKTLEGAFSAFGDILESKIINDRETGRSRGFGFVTFADEQSMRDAIKGMDGQLLDGRNITVNEAQSRSGGGGGGGYRSREGGSGSGGYSRGGGGYSRGGGGGGGGDYGSGQGYGGGSRYPRNGGDSGGNWRN